MEKWHAFCVFMPGDRHQAGETANPPQGQTFQWPFKSDISNKWSYIHILFSSVLLDWKHSGQAEESCRTTETALLNPHRAAVCLQTCLQGRSVHIIEPLIFFSKNTPILTIARYNPLYKFPIKSLILSEICQLAKVLNDNLDKSRQFWQPVCLPQFSHTPVYIYIYTHRAGGREYKISPRIACPPLFATGQIAFSHAVFYILSPFRQADREMLEKNEILKG